MGKTKVFGVAAMLMAGLASLSSPAYAQITVTPRDDVTVKCADWQFDDRWATRTFVFPVRLAV